MNATLRMLATVLCAMPIASWAAERHSANERVVLDYIEAMDRATARAAVEDVPKIVATYWTEDCVQHRAGVGPGRAGVIAAIQSLPVFANPASAPAASAPFRTVSIRTSDNRVILVRRSVQVDANDSSKTSERYVFNIFRIEHGKIAENWWAMSS